jgi:regulatory protein
MKRISAKSIENAAVFYLRRYAASVKQLQLVLKRKCQRVNRERKEEVDFPPLVEEVVGKLEKLGYLNDAALAVSKASSLRRSGKSARMIRSKLQVKGLGAQAAAVHEPRADETAIWVYARKKRLGVFAPAGVRKEKRMKHLASLARAGFSFSLAKLVVDATEVPEDA